MLSTQYSKTKSRSTMRGEWFEVKVSAMLFLRSKNSDSVSRFQLATNVEGAGALDDIVYRLLTNQDQNTWYTAFVQLKHKDRSTLRMESFTGPVGDFSLLKYLKSFNDIKKATLEGSGNEPFFKDSLDFFQFVIYTNAKADRTLVTRKHESCNEGALVELLRSSGNSELIFKFDKEADAEVFSILGQTNDDVSEFLGKLTVFLGEPTESDLDDVIKKELLMACGASVADAEALYRIFEGLFKQWWRDSNDILDETSDILQRAIDQLSSETELTRQTNECTFDLRFDKSLWKSFKTGFSRGVSFLHVITTGMSLKLTATKVLMLLHTERLSFTFISLEYLLIHQSAIIPDWQDGYKDCLVVVSNCQKSYDQDALVNLSKGVNQVLIGYHNKKVVVVAKLTCQFGSLLQKGLGANEYKQIDGTFHFTDLDEFSQAKLFWLEVSFQEYKMSLQSVIAGDLNFWTSLLSDGLVETLLSDKSIIIGTKLSSVIPHFIPRRLKIENCLKLEILKSDNMTTELFAVSGVTIQELQQLVQNEEHVKLISDQFLLPKHPINSKTGRPMCFVLEAKKAFKQYDKLCQTRSNVHWLHMENGVLKWRSSFRNIGTIKRYLIQSRETEIQSEEIVTIDCKIVLVIAEPGMGKSTLLPALAKTAKNANPSDWVIYINLRERIGLFNQSPQFSVIDFITSALHIESSLERVFLRASLELKGNVVILFDSFDEICPGYEEEGCALLKSILNTKVKKLVVTSRHCMQDMLEDHLSTLAYNIVEFSEKDQRMFFRTFWSESSTYMPPIELESFITRLLDSVNVIDPGKRFMGIPLQTMMLAEIFHDHVTDPQNNDFPEKLDMLNLIEQFIEKKFAIHFRKGNRNLNRKDSKEKFLEDHMHAALMLFVSDEDIHNLRSKKNIVSSADVFLRNVEQAKYNFGIIVGVVNRLPNFIHQMFAEYFAGLWFVENFASNRDFLKDYLFHPNHNVIRSTFDHILSKGHKLHEAVLDEDVLLVETLLAEEGTDIDSTDQGGRSALHLASALEFVAFPNRFYYIYDGRFIGPRPRHLVELLLHHGASITMTDTIFQWTPLRYAYKTRSLDAMEFLLSSTPESEKCNFILSDSFIEDYVTIIKIVFSNRLFNIFTILLHRLCVSFVLHGETLLHTSSRYGYLEFVQLLLSKGADKREKDIHNNVAIHVASRYGHLSVVRYLIENKPRRTKSTFFKTKLTFSPVRKYVNAFNRDGDTALHFAPTVDIVSLLISHGANIWKLNHLRRSILHSAARFGRLGVVKMLIEDLGLESDVVLKLINAGDLAGRSALSLASQHGHSEVMSLLIYHGADVWSRDKTMLRTSLHWATFMGQLNAVKILLKSLGIDYVKVVRYINTVDKDGVSALILSSKWGHSDIVCALLSYGADIWVRDKKGRTSLHYLQDINVAQAIIESMGEDKADIVKYVNSLDNENMSAVSLASTLVQSDIVQLLTYHGADVWATDVYGRTALHYASNTHVVKTIIESLGKDKETVIKYVNTVECQGKSAIFLASEKERTDIVQLLIFYGANLWVRDHVGRTCLHYASNIHVAEVIIESLRRDNADVTEFVNIVDNDGKSAFCTVSSDIQKFLVIHGADVWVRLRRGQTFLHIAAEDGDLTEAQRLIGRLGDKMAAIVEYINIRSNRGLTALEVAAKPSVVDSSVGERHLALATWLEEMLVNSQKNLMNSKPTS